jgi:hypothetical protein
MESTDSSDIYTGYARKDGHIWTVEFPLEKPPENYNMTYSIKEFKLVALEDKSGKFVRKIPAYAINANYYLRKHPLHVRFKREDLDFIDFYNQNRKGYDEFTGQVTEYFYDGSICMTYYLINGKLNGTYTSYFYKKGICEQSYFIDGLRHGKAFHHDYDGFDIECEFNMGEIVSYNITMLDNRIFEIYEDYCWKNNNGDIIDNTIVNIDCDDFYGTITINNGHIDANTITLTEEKSMSLLKKNFCEIPDAISDRKYFTKLSYWYGK